MNNEPLICSICQGEYSNFGNNAWPINEGRCCDGCDTLVVFPARLRSMHRRDAELKAQARRILAEAGVVPKSKRRR